MPVQGSLLITACLIGSLLLSACARDTENSVNPIGPTAVPAAATATAALVVQVDSVCAGQESNIRVFVDLVPIGVTNPGEAGVSHMVTVGEHQLSAISQRGTEWGPFPTTVTAAGLVERLGCMPPDAI